MPETNRSRSPAIGPIGSKSTWMVIVAIVVAKARGGSIERESIRACLYSDYFSSCPRGGVWCSSLGGKGNRIILVQNEDKRMGGRMEGGSG